jgi:hypothetical protein
VLRVLIKVLLAAAALAAVWAFVPVAGRTMADRWHRARNPSEFVDRAWGEIRGEPHPAQAQRPHAPPHSQAGTGSPPARPTESHSDADRKALDRILSEHVRE